METLKTVFGASVLYFLLDLHWHRLAIQSDDAKSTFRNIWRQAVLWPTIQNTRRLQRQQ